MTVLLFYFSAVTSTQKALVSYHDMMLVDLAFQVDSGVQINPKSPYISTTANTPGLFFLK